MCFPSFFFLILFCLFSIYPVEYPEKPVLINRFKIHDVFLYSKYPTTIIPASPKKNSLPPKSNLSIGWSTPIESRPMWESWGTRQLVLQLRKPQVGGKAREGPLAPVVNNIKVLTSVIKMEIRFNTKEDWADSRTSKNNGRTTYKLPRAPTKSVLLQFRQMSRPEISLIIIQTCPGMIGLRY